MSLTATPASMLALTLLASSSGSSSSPHVAQPAHGDGLRRDHQRQQQQLHQLALVSVVIAHIHEEWGLTHSRCPRSRGKVMCGTLSSISRSRWFLMEARPPLSEHRRRSNLPLSSIHPLVCTSQNYQSKAHTQSPTPASTGTTETGSESAGSISLDPHKS
jgi:hypothetical protein